MKHTQWKDALRNIRKQFLLFLSIAAITMMGTAAYLSIHFSILAMAKNGSAGYTGLKFRDFEVISTKLLSPADLEAIREMDGVAAAEPVWQTSGKVTAGDRSEEVTIVSITEETNLPMVLEGRLPVGAMECAVEARLMDQFGWRIGDTIVLRGADGENPKYLRSGTLRVTCVANHPDHTNLAAPDSLYILVSRDAFDLSALGGCSMKAEVILEKDADISLFGAEYKSLTAEAKDRLEALAMERVPLRDQELQAQYAEELAESRAKLKDAERELAEARQQLEEGEAAITDAEKTLAEKRGELAEAREQLESGAKALEEGETKLAEAREQLVGGKAALLRANDQLTYAKIVLEDGQNQMNAAMGKAQQLIQEADLPFDENTSLEEIQSALEDGAAGEDADQYADIDVSYWRDRLQRLNNLRGQMAYAKVDLAQAEEKYHQGVAQYNAGLAEYEQGIRELGERRAEYAQGRQDYEAGLGKMREAEAELQEKKAELEDGKAEYQKGLREYQEGAAKLAEAEERLGLMAPGRWLLLRMQDNTSFAWQNGTVTQTRQIEAVFSTLFLVISILVIYSSIQKLVLEQRTLVGVGKALGLYNREILGKYLLFGLLGTTAGMMAGTAIARFVLEPLVLTSSGLFLLLDLSRPLFDLPSALLMAVLVELAAFLSVFVGCRTLLRSSATSLMQTHVPRGGRRASRRQGRGMPLMLRVIPREMRSSPGRVLVTIVSVAGCCALVVMGFTTKNRIDGVTARQYPGITDYDLEVTFDGSAAAREELEQALRDAGTEFVLVGSEEVICGEGERTAAVLVTGDLSAVSGFYHLRDYASGEALPLGEEGIYVHRGMAETFHLSPGDPLMISMGFDDPVRVRTGQVYDNYLGWKIFLSDAGYEAAFGKPAVQNTFFVRLGGAEEARLKDRLAGIAGFEKAAAADSDREIFASVSSIMNLFVVLMIVLAAILAAFVIVSLTRCYLLQKNNEAVVMRINGFTIREVILYLMAEIIADTILGILLGFVVGESLSAYMLGQMEADYFRFVRGIDIPAMLCGAGITALFSFLVNAFCLRPLKKMSLLDLD